MNWWRWGFTVVVEIKKKMVLKAKKRKYCHFYEITPSLNGSTELQRDDLQLCCMWTFFWRREEAEVCVHWADRAAWIGRNLVFRKADQCYGVVVSPGQRDTGYTIYIRRDPWHILSLEADSVNSRAASGGQTNMITYTCFSKSPWGEINFSSVT